MEVFRFADINIGLSYEVDIFSRDYRSEMFKLNNVDESEIDVVFHMNVLETDEFANAKCLRRTGAYELLETQHGLFLLNHWGNIRFGYGVWMADLYKGNTIQIYVNEGMVNQIPINIVRFMGTIGLHSVLLMKKLPVLHASYVEYNKRAVLFSAPSGTGKSTQAELWKEIAGAEIINGDRVLLREKNGIWNAYGYPCCGSSDICVNKTLPVAAIVILQKGTENVIEELTTGQKVRMLVSAMELYLWENKEMEQAFIISEELIAKVPMIKLVCRPDSEAVQELKQFLEDKGYV